MKTIPLVDLKTQYLEIKSEINAAIKKVLESAHFILGEEVEDFEKKFAKVSNTKYAVGVASGLNALELGMRALGIGQGDEVITPVNSFIASSSAISFTEAKPIFIDCEENSFNIDPKKIEEKINSKTKAIMPVHLYGRPSEMDQIQRIAKKYGLEIIEDACQAHGAFFKGKRVGSFGSFAAFSFYPGKNLGAYGDGGMLTTNNHQIAKKVIQMRNYGQTKKYHHEYLAWNSRLDTIQAAVLLVKLQFLDIWNNARRKNAKLYNKLLKGLPIITPEIPTESEHVFHLYVIRYGKRDNLAKYLKTKGIMTGLHYPIPIHLQTAYSFLGHKQGDFPISEKLSNEILSLPMFPHLKEEQISFISETIKKFFKT